MAILRYQNYPDEHYFTLFNPKTGFFIRSEEPEYDEPFWSAHGPEMLDISITSWCGKECETCYRESSRKGSHMSLSDYANVISQAAQLGTIQVALGGGNPNEHPQFVEILRLTRRDYGIVPNYTTNGHGLSPSVLRASAEFCGAVALSVYEPYSFLANAIRKLKDHNVRTNLHFVLDAKSAEVALAWFHDPPEFMRWVNAIVFLNYKPVGRGARQNRLLRNYGSCQALMKEATTGRHEFKVGFDSCLVTGLLTAGRTNPVWFDACEAARFTMFISEQLQMYPCSFMEKLHSGISLTETTMLDAWKYGKSFCATRQTLRNPRCGRCHMQSVCHGGCPVFPEINLCDESALRVKYK